MTGPPPIQAHPRRKVVKVVTMILVVSTCISALILVVLLIRHLDREGIIMFRSDPDPVGKAYYYPADLKAVDLPPWDGTNAIPLTPDQAVLASMRHLTLKYPNGSSWEVDNIDLRKVDTTWIYNISLIVRQPGREKYEVVKVLMNGNIWHPDGKRNR